MLGGCAGAAKWKSLQPAPHAGASEILRLIQHTRQRQLTLSGAEPVSTTITLSTPHILIASSCWGEKKKNVPNASLIPPRITPRVIEEASKQPSCDEWVSDSSAALCELSSPNKGRLSGLSALRGAEPALTQEQPPLNTSAGLTLSLMSLLKSPGWMSWMCRVSLCLSSPEQRTVDSI